MRIEIIFVLAFLAIVDCKETEIEDIKIVEIGGMQYAQVQIGSMNLKNSGGKIVHGYLKTTFDTSFLDRDMNEIEKEYASLSTLHGIPNSIFALVPDFVKLLISPLTSRFLPRFLLGQNQDEIYSQLLKVRMEYNELKVAMKSVEIKKSPVKPGEKVMDFQMNHAFFYDNDYDFTKKDLSTPEGRLLYKISRILTAILHMKNCLTKGLFDLGTWSKRMDAKTNNAVRSLIKDEPGLKKVNVNTFQTTFTALKKDKLEAYFEVPLILRRHEAKKTTKTFNM